MAYSKEFLAELAQAQDVFVWEMPAFEYHERHPKWYIWMALVAVALVGYGIYTSNYMFAFIILLTSIILVLAGNEKPQPALVQIGTNGVTVNGRFYLYDQLNDFAILYQPPETKVLYLQPKNALKPRLRLTLEDEDPVAVRNHLKKYLEEDLDLREEHFSDIFARFLRL